MFSKPILQYDLDGSFIREWPSTYEIYESYGFSRSAIARCCRGEYKQMMGYNWKYKIGDEIPQSINATTQKLRRVVQCDKDGNFIAEFDSIAEAEKQTGVIHSSIISCCKGKYKQAGGFIWHYK